MSSGLWQPVLMLSTLSWFDLFVRVLREAHSVLQIYIEYSTFCFRIYLKLVPKARGKQREVKWGRRRKDSCRARNLFLHVLGLELMNLEEAKATSHNPVVR